MERRAFLSSITVGLLAAPLAAEAQPAGKVAFLCPGNCSSLPNAVMDWDRAFLAGFERAGYVFGRNASLDMSGAGVGFGRLSDAAKRLVERKVDVIVAFGNEATQAARQATKSTPIVMVNVADAVDEGLVASLGRPGANVTGLSVPLGQLTAKHLELLKEINPRLARVAVLWSPTIELRQERFVPLERAARNLGVQVSPLRIATARDLENTFGSMGPERPDGLLLFEQLIGPVRPEIALFALRHRVVTAASDWVFARGGRPPLVRAIRPGPIRTCRALRWQAPAGHAAEPASRGRTHACRVGRQGPPLTPSA
jgi:putative tryptophan/tyrosine transport system substrate-binding protein